MDPNAVDAFYPGDVDKVCKPIDLSTVEVEFSI